ncbi:MAG: DUF1566 domain-containing protein [Gammaproteobacteria bacterium]|nr:DUF1566 domain-containing protein [Gammaproteobacteria bacterium]
MKQTSGTQFFLSKLLIMLILAVYGCGGGSPNSQFHIGTEDFKVEFPSALDGYLTEDMQLIARVKVDETSTFSLSVDPKNKLVFGSIPGLSNGEHTLVIEYAIKIDNDEVIIARNTIRINIGDFEILVLDNQVLVYIDSDSDGVTNIDELKSGTYFTDGNKYSVGGTVIGLSGSGLVLRNNNQENLTIGANGDFAFPTQLASDSTYAITVLSQPGSPSQICKVDNGSGTVSNADINNIVVSCVRSYTVEVAVNGLSGTGLVLQNSGGDNLSVVSNGTFSFATKLIAGNTYEVTIFAQPLSPKQICEVINGSGTISQTDITNISINCVTDIDHSIAINVKGLHGSGLVLQNNNTDDLSVNSDGPAIFTTPVRDGDTYHVSILTQPNTPDQTCMVNNATGTVNGNDVNLDVYCHAFSATTCDGPVIDGACALSMVKVADFSSVLCVDNLATNNCPSASELYYGQDGNSTINPESFTNNGTVISEAVTGLVWTPTAYAADTLTLAIDQCNSLASSNFGDRNDWRVPSIRELSRIASKNANTGSWPTEFNTPQNSYWWSTTEAKNLAGWQIGMSGNWPWTVLEQSDGTGGFAGARYVYCVGGSQMAGTWGVHPDSVTVTHTVTNLMWHRASSSNLTDWDNGLQYCQNSNVGGYTDWRVPTLREYMSVLDYVNNTAIYMADVFTDVKDVPMLTSTPNRIGVGYIEIAAVNEHTGVVSQYNVNSLNGGVRCVRGPIFETPKCELNPPPSVVTDFIVSATQGDDSLPDPACPVYKTLTAAVSNALPNSTIWVAPGVYDSANGEVFPITPTNNIVIIGDAATRGLSSTPTLISGSAQVGTTGYSAAFYDNIGITIKGLNIVGGSAIRNFGIFSEDANSIIQQNTFDGSYGGVRLYGTGAPDVSANDFNTSSYGTYITKTADVAIINNNLFSSPALPIDNVSGNAMIQNNEIIGSGQVGIQVQNGSPFIEWNTFTNESYTYGAITPSSDSTPQIYRNTFNVNSGHVIFIRGNAAPELGTTQVDGGNTFLGTSGFAIESESPATVSAIGNTWYSNPPNCVSEIVVTGGGTVIWGAVSGESCP